MNALYYGDNLHILKQHIASESVDLVYLDPPFNSNRNYNLLFKQAKDTGRRKKAAPADSPMEDSAAQIMAFEDTWQYKPGMFEEFAEDPANGRLLHLMNALKEILGHSEMLAYLLMMAPRLLQLHRVMKPTASLYLHCDPVASHYLKIVLDVVFGPEHFVNEITWKRTNSHNTARRFGNVADSILFYEKSSDRIWNPVYVEYGKAQLGRYKVDKDGRYYRGDDLTGDRTNSTSGKFEWRGTTPGPTRGWGYTVEQLEKWWEEGRILVEGRHAETGRLESLSR